MIARAVADSPKLLRRLVGFNIAHYSLFHPDHGDFKKELFDRSKQSLIHIFSALTEKQRMDFITLDKRYFDEEKIQYFLMFSELKNELNLSEEFLKAVTNLCYFV